MKEPLTSLVEIVPAILPSEGVAGTDDEIYGAVLDLNTYKADRVLMVVTFGILTSTAATAIKAQTDTAEEFGSPLDVVGSAQAVADDNSDGTFAIDLWNPPERFVRLAVTRATANAVIASAYYFVYGLRVKPAVQTAVGYEVIMDQATGTA
jgi:hypothetical protein